MRYWKLQDICYRVASRFNGFTSDSATDRQTDRQGHPRRPSGLKPALRHLVTRRFSRVWHSCSAWHRWDIYFDWRWHFLEFTDFQYTRFQVLLFGTPIWNTNEFICASFWTGLHINVASFMFLTFLKKTFRFRKSSSRTYFELFWTYLHLNVASSELLPDFENNFALPTFFFGTAWCCHTDPIYM